MPEPAAPVVPAALVVPGASSADLTPWEPVQRRALDLARSASRRTPADVPIGAVVVGPDGTVVGEGVNERELRNDPCAHAEVLALQAAAARLGSWRLGGCTVVVTLEPCPMCAGALVNARVRRVVFGAADLKAGAMGSLYNLGADPRLNHEIDVRAGLLADECAELLTSFFAGLR